MHATGADSLWAVAAAGGSRTSSIHQAFPRTADRASEARGRRHEDIRLSRLDLLHGTDVEVGPLGKALLGEVGRTAFPADIRAKPQKRLLDVLFLWHALLCRIFPLDVTAQ